MPTDTSHRLYNLSPLVPLLESGHLLLTPNYRLARRIKSEWDRLQVERGLQVWQPVPVYPLQTWLLQCWQEALGKGQVRPRVRMDAVQQKELWSRVIDEDRRNHDEYSLLQTSSAADLAQEARDNLLRWQVDTGSSSAQSEFRLDQDCSTYLRWMNTFEEALEEQGFATEADVLLDLLNSDYTPGTVPVALVDFDDLPPLHLALLQKLGSTITHVSGAGGEAEVIARSYPDRAAELTAVARWAAAGYEKQPERTLGILLADMQGDRAALEYLLRREFDCLGANYTSLPVNFSTGIKLDQAPVVRDALSLLATGGEQLSLPDVVALIRSRFTRLRDRHDDRVVKLLQQLHEDGAQLVDLGRLRHKAQQVKVGERAGLELGNILVEVAGMRLGRLRQQPSLWVGELCQVLDAWGWPGSGPLDSLEFQQVEGFYQVLEDFAAFDALSGAINYGEALGLLRRCCQSRVSQPQTSDSNIQVLGPLEGAGLHFDAVWLCGMQGSRWPAPARVNPFIPVAVQRRHRMPHSSAEREWEYAHNLLKHYRGGCSSLVTSFSRQLDGVPELPSPLLAGLQIERFEMEESPPQSWLSQQAGATLQTLEDARAPSVEADELDSLSRGSGLLQDQANCPFRAFAAKRLSLEPLGDYRAGLSAADRGSILHNALYVLWGELNDSTTLLGMGLASIDGAIKRAAETAIAELPSGLRQLVGMPCLDLELDRLQNLLHEWISVERARGPFTVECREEPVSLQLGPLAFNLRIDRIDRLADGQTLVIDYKSGRNSLTDWLGERPSQPQLPLYGVATEVGAIAFAQVKARESKMLGLGEIEGVTGVREDIEKAVKSRSEASDWLSLKQEWARNLERLAGAFLAGEAAVDPLPGACNYCGMQSLCRVELAPEMKA